METLETLASSQVPETHSLLRSCCVCPLVYLSRVFEELPLDKILRRFLAAIVFLVPLLKTSLAVNSIEKVKGLNLINAEALLLALLVLLRNLPRNLGKVLQNLKFWLMILKRSFIRDTVFNIKETKPCLLSSELLLGVNRLAQMLVFILYLNNRVPNPDIIDSLNEGEVLYVQMLVGLPAPEVLFRHFLVALIISQIK